jgi:hypothetical protein
MTLDTKISVATLFGQINKDTIALSEIILKEYNIRIVL